MHAHQHTRLLVATAMVALAASTAAAQTGGEIGEVLSFPAEYFTEFRPNSVVDMLNRLPGFAYSSGDSSVRGAAGSGGNVLVDGARPTSKSLSLSDILRRLPLEAIERIDLIRGGAPGIDMLSQPIVANVIRKPGGYMVATVQLQTKIYNDHQPAQMPSFELSRSWGNWNAGGAIRWRNKEREQEDTGDGSMTRHNLLTGEREYAAFHTHATKTRLDGNFGLEYSDGAHLLRLNASGQRESEDRDEQLKTLVLANRESWNNDTSSNLSEFGFDYEYGFPSGLISRVMLLRRAERKKKDGISDVRGADQHATEDSLSREIIGRLSATYTPSPMMTFEASVEGSRNTLDSESELLRNGIPVPLPSAVLQASEKRGNFAASARWQPSASASFEVGTGYEISTIAQSGGASNEKTLKYWKPRLNMTFDPANLWQVRFRGERMVGQLDFRDFAASVSTEPGVTNVGNPDLVPETAWYTELAIERRFWERGSITLSAEREFLSDIVDLIPIENRFDAPGNIGDGWRQRLMLEMSLPTDRLAIPGGLVRLKVTKHDSSVTDPVTGENRRIRDQWPHGVDLQTSKNIPSLNSVLGIDMFLGYKKTTYRLTETRVERSNSQPLARFYWDWNPDRKTAIRFQIENFTFRERGRMRTIYQGSRASGVVSMIEDRAVTMDPFFMVRVRRRL